MLFPIHLNGHPLHTDAPVAVASRSDWGPLDVAIRSADHSGIKVAMLSAPVGSRATLPGCGREFFKAVDGRWAVVPAGWEGIDA